MNISTRRIVLTMLIAMSTIWPASAMAIDGIIEINQAAALAGGVTSGDTPGFPVLLSEPGSYVMTSNLTLPDTNTDGIELVAATGSIQIDMNGFLILGSGTCTPFCPVTSCTGGTGRGVYSDTAILGVGLRNGGIQGMGAAGVDVIGGVSLDAVFLANNGGDGVRIASGAGRFENVIPSRNGGDGIHGEPTLPLRAREVTTSCNLGDGIEAGPASTIVDSTAITDGGRGFVVGFGSLVRDSVSTSHLTGFGLECSATAGIGGNIFTSNNGAGANFSSGCTAIDSNICDGALCP
jgi:hypothetical protein